MKAVCWCGKGKVRVEDVAMPRILNPRDAIVKVTLTTICGSDLHLYNGFVPSMLKGDILGHETVGEVVEIGRDVRNLSVGDRVVIAFGIACGRCWYCRNNEFSLCDNSNPNAALMEKMYSFSTAGIFGYSHLFGGYAGGQADYLRVPFADVGAFKIPDGMSDEQALPFADIFPTGFMGAEQCNIKPGDVVAVWGCGPVGQFVIKSAFMLGAEQVIAIDNVPERLHLAARESGATPLNHDKVDLYDALKTLTGGRGPDACVDAVGMEAHGHGWLMSAYDRVKTALYMQTERAHVVRAIIQACRKGGTLSIMGVYGMVVDKFPLGMAFSKGLHFNMGQAHCQRYIPRLFDYWRQGKVDPSFIFSHHLPLCEAADAYRIFRDKRQHCIKIALRPNAALTAAAPMANAAVSACA
jgi:threonine dehydrogenase-like Zn-dependent dehydrogenase